jgi:hypothetical protein
VTFALTTIEQQYAAAKRLYNIDAPERKSVSPQARRKELTGFAAYNKNRSRKAADPQDELVKYKAIADPPEAQDPLDW